MYPADGAVSNAKVCATVVGAGSAEVDPNENAAGVGVNVSAVDFAPNEVAPNEYLVAKDDDAVGRLVWVLLAGADPNEIDGVVCAVDDIA